MEGPAQLVPHRTEHGTIQQLSQVMTLHFTSPLLTSHDITSVIITSHITSNNIKSPNITQSLRSQFTAKKNSDTK
jgi:hypothetical protein